MSNLPTRTTNRSLPKAAIGKISVRQAFNEAMDILDAEDTATFTLHTTVAGVGVAGDTIQECLVVIGAALADFESRIATLETP